MGLSKLLKSSAQKKQLFSATVELTPQCNLNCSFCYVCDRHLKTASGNERSTREWLDLLREAAALGLFLVSFTGGEVLMRPDFEEIYCKSCEIGLRPTILTNGTLLDEKKITYLKK
ncbi:MAG: radical SAM protein, partial [Eubacterium sp.]